MTELISQPSLWLGGAVLCSLLWANPTVAQSITAAPDGTGTTVEHNGNTYHISGGTSAGTNLFHSFQALGLDSGEIANFLSHPGVNNILGRVTGGAPSIINGLIQVTGANSNLYLMNPAGIVFGSGARLQVGGDFTATTADRLGFEGGWFNATGINDYAALVGAPNQFAFASATPGAILNFGDLTTEQHLSLVGGTVLNQGKVVSTQGTITLAAVPGERLVKLSQPGMLLSLELPQAAMTATLEPLDLPILLTGSGRETGVAVGDLAIAGEVAGQQIDLYAAGQVQPSPMSIFNAPKTRVVRFSSEGHNPNQAVFIDAYADDPEALLFGTEAGTIAQIIHPDEQGIAVITEQLAQISDAVGPLDSVAIAAEGNVGSFWLGNQWIRSNNIHHYQTQLQAWQGTLTETADILLYSCFTALGATGDALINSIATFTGADVAASTDVTGHGQQGGNWALERRTGSIDSTHPFTETTLTDWQGTLATLTVNSNVDNTTGGDSQVTLREAVNAANIDGTITDLGETSSGWDEIRFSGVTAVDLTLGELEIDDNVTITGGATHVTVQRDTGAGDFRIFDVAADHATFENLTIRNGRVVNTNGGGVRHRGNGTLTFDRVTVSGNSAVLGSSGGEGGGIWTHRGTLAIHNSTLSSNSASDNGGAIRGNDEALTITDTIILGNQAGNNGGGLRTDQAPLTLTDVTFSSNSAGNDGGGLVTSDGDITLTRTHFLSNVAGTDGGGLRATQSAITTTDSIFFGNAAGNDGGGLNAKQGAIAAHRVTITGNSAGTNGGGLHTSQGAVTITDSTVTGNSAGADGGGLRTQSGAITASHTTLSGNSAGQDGGGLRTNQGTVNLSNSNLAGNSAGNDGGGLRSGDGLITISNTSITNNVAASNGGGIRNDEGLMTVTSATFSGNSATQNGGAIRVDDDPLHISQTTFSNNRAGDDGGGVHGGNGAITVNQSTLSGNSAGRDGGAIQNNGGAITISHSTLLGNGASQRGGDISIADAPLVITQHLGNANLDIEANQGVSVSGNGAIALTGEIATQGEDVMVQATTSLSLTGLALSSTAGGDITLTAGGDINTKNLFTYGGAPDSGNITLTSTGGAINTFNGTLGSIDARAGAGNGGRVHLTAAKAIATGPINTESFTGIGGSVTLESETFVTVNGTVTSSFVPFAASLSTAGQTASGAITLRHGGNGLVPFVVGNASVNGTSAAITTGSQTLLPTNSYLKSYTDQPGIQLLTQGNLGSLTNIALAGVEPITSAVSTERLIELIGQQAGGITKFQGQGKFKWDLPGDQALGGSLGESEIFQALTQLDAFLGGDYAVEETAAAAEEKSESSDSEENDNEDSMANLRETFSRIQEQTGTTPALIYALSQPDALELIVVTPDNQLLRKVIPAADRDTLHRTVRIFRRHIISLSPNYLSPAQQLYDWLIRPIEGVLDNLNIDTLVFAMGDGLRTLPMAALHDGEQFLVETYSLGQIPSLSLTDSSYVPLQDANVLAMGAAQFDVLDPLPAVPSELALITNLTSGEQHLNSGFTWENLRNQSRDRNFEIVHLATHAAFKPGSAHNSYIQLWGNDQISVDELRELRWFEDPQVELLVLSACETAFGDPYAELGFAGLAVQAGVKSTLASLWKISDLGTMRLMREFYEQLDNPDVTIKAEALRQAQLALLRGEATAQNALPEGMTLPPELVRYTDTDLTHPFYWSAFTLVGSPW
ncbi:MAG: CHAT domain-containing protein [Cyanobacteria bacterium P01_G01_bin.54]